MLDVFNDTQYYYYYSHFHLSLPTLATHADHITLAYYVTKMAKKLQIIKHIIIGASLVTTNK